MNRIALLGLGPLTVLTLCATTVRAAAQGPAVERYAPHEAGGIAYRVTAKPAAPDVGETVVIELEIAAVLASPDPTYGTRRPINDAQPQAAFVPVAPAQKGKTPAALPVVRNAVRFPDAGTYGFSFTPSRPGIYGVFFSGPAGDAGELAHAVFLPVGTWPTPDGTTLPSLPKTLPAPTIADAAHGRSLCQRHCAKDLEGALPKGDTPTFLASSVAMALDDAALLKWVTGAAASSLDAVQRHDLLHVLRAMHMDVRTFFPEATTVIPHTFTVSSHGRKRLKESAKIELTDEQARGAVFAVFKGGDPKAAPRFVPYEDRVTRDQLKASDKLGYLVFAQLPGEPKAAELAFALGREPTYPIVGLRARGAGGEYDSAFNKQLATFVGLGRFNDPGSLTKGSKGLRDALTPIYLRVAELATAYFAEERELAEFDAELK